MRDRALAFRDHRHRRAPDRVTSDRRIDVAAAREYAMHEREILAADASRLQLPDEIALRAFALRDDQEPAGVLVEAMHDAGARQRCKLPCMVQQRVRKRALGIA